MQQPAVLVPGALRPEAPAERGSEVESTVMTPTDLGAVLLVSTLRTVHGPSGWYRMRTWHRLRDLSQN